MTKTFSSAEKHIIALFQSGETFIFNDEEFTVQEADKPRVGKGECKTDIYALSTNAFGEPLELKISFKQDNADFLENKMSTERAQEIFGDAWQNVIRATTAKIKNSFEKSMLIYLEKHKRTEKGAITLGWKFEFVNKPNGKLSGLIVLTEDQVADVYAGTSLPANKRDALVNGREIHDSGVADYILIEDHEYHSLQDVINNLQTIEDYAHANPNIYFACKALNYRTYKHKYDGNRPLAVFVDWYITNGKLDCSLRFDDPLNYRGTAAAEQLTYALDLLNIKTTDDITIDKLDGSVLQHVFGELDF